MNRVLAILLSFGSLCNAQTTASLIIAPQSGTSTAGVLTFREGTAASAKTITFRVPPAGITASYPLYWPIAQAAAGGGYLFNDGAGNLSWQAVTGGGGGPVTNVTATLPITSSGGATPNIACPNCMRIDANNVPTGAFNLGSTGNWWLGMYSGTFQVPVTGCADAAYVSGTSLFGGRIFIKNGSCVVQAEMNSNGFDTVNTVGSYRIQGVTVIDPNRDATVRNLTITGTCIGCPTSGGGSVSAVTASYPIQSSGGSSPNISCSTCMHMTTNNINVPGFNVEIGTAANWIYRQYTQSYYSPNGVVADAALVTSTALFGGQIYTKNGAGTVQAQMNGSGFDTVGSVGVYKVQGTTVIDASRNGAFVGVTASSFVNSTVGFIANGAFGSNTTMTVRNSAGTGTCTITVVGGLVTGTTC